MGSSASSEAARTQQPPARQGLTTGKTEKEREKESERPASRSSSSSSIIANAEGACDVMISYSHSNKDVMELVKDTLESHGYSVWVDRVGLRAGVDFLRKIGQAIIDCKAVIAILSERAVQSKYCQDELALAYISSKPVLPVAVEPRDKLYSDMDMGLRLQLASFQWTELLDSSTYRKGAMQIVDLLGDSIGPPGIEVSPEVSEPPRLTREKSRIGGVRRGSASARLPNSFWDRNFGTESSVPWDKFCSVFCKQYASELNKICVTSEDRSWLLNVLRRELKVTSSGILLHKYYLEFCREEGELRPFWPCVREQAAESLAIREVFDVHSSVRVDAIENLSKFRSAQVVELLIDLLVDEDTNIVTVAAISLARTGCADEEVVDALLACLQRGDRLVREAGCLALGHLKAAKAVPELVRLWRNDFISSVREAATQALKQVGGEEAEKAMHVTGVLQAEIRRLNLM